MLLWESLVETYFLITLFKACWKTTTLCSWESLSFTCCLTCIANLWYTISPYRNHTDSFLTDCVYSHSQRCHYFIVYLSTSLGNQTQPVVPHRVPFVRRKGQGITLATCQSSNTVALCNGQVEALASHSAISSLNFSQVKANWPGDLLTAKPSIWSNTFCIFTQTHLVHLTSTLLTRKNSSGVKWCLQQQRAMKGINWTSLLQLYNSRVLPYSLVIKWFHLCPTWLPAFDLRTFD